MLTKWRRCRPQSIWLGGRPKRRTSALSSNCQAQLWKFLFHVPKRNTHHLQNKEKTPVSFYLKKIPLWYNMNTFFSKFPPTTGCAVGIRTRRVRFLLTVEEGKTEVEVFHQICVSHHHVKHISGPGLNVTANHHILSIRKHYSHFSLRRTRTSFSGLCWVHTNKHTHTDTKNTFTCRYTIQTVYVQHHIT